MKFCFFGDVSGAIKGNTPGGAELQIVLLARALALKGHEVVIIDPYADEDFITHEGIKLITVPEWKKGIKILRLFFYRIPVLHKAFINQKADYYYIIMRSYLHLIPYFAAKKTGAKFIQALASDLDVLSGFKKFKYEYKSSVKQLLTQGVLTDLVFKYLLEKSDFVMLQHAGQKFAANSKKNNQVIFPNPIDLSSIPVVMAGSKNYYIYVGALTIQKGSHNLLRLINMLNDSIPIVVVGSAKDKKSEKVYEALRKKKNVVLKGQRSHKETLELISNAKALFNTSYYEGFPNTYLEAWACGIPVISLNSNPGNIIDRYGLGVWCNASLERMKRCMEDEETVNIDRGKLVHYVNEFHNLETVADRFLDIIK
jgi:glycosyltransferase involved in cell wall biosynthesis